MMRIQLFDKGSAKGKQLFANLEIVCKRLQLDFDPEYIKDMNKIYSRGVMGDTILVINNEVALIDRYPAVKEIENLISDFLK